MFGDVIFEAGGKSYTCRMSVGACRLVEQYFKKPMAELVSAERVPLWGFDEITVFLWAGLHKRYGLTQAQVEDIIEEIELEAATQIVVRSLQDGASRERAEGANRSAHPPQEPMPGLTTTPH